MYEWLDEEIATIKARKFHVIDIQKKDELLSMPAESYSLLPPSYMAFVSKYGWAKLYGKSGYAYQVGVLSSPKTKTLKSGETLLCIGHYDDSKAYFLSSLLAKGSDSPVFEWTEEGIEQVANSFEEWITMRCEDARNSYSEEEWEEIVNGPKPFTSEEKQIVEARKKFKWELIGFTEDGNLKIKVENNSNLTLPYLTIGFQGKYDEHNSMQGAVWLDVSEVKPGQERVLSHSGYKEIVDRENVELYQLEDPIPEERSRFWEFRKISEPV